LDDVLARFSAKSDGHNVVDWVDDVVLVVADER
jgi:hypothetical protein